MNIGVRICWLLRYCRIGKQPEGAGYVEDLRMHVYKAFDPAGVVSVVVY